MSLETIQIEHVPATHRVHVALFRDVSNADFLQSQLLARNADFEYAFIDASSVASRLQLLSAVYRALTNLIDGTLQTNNVHSEVVISLSPSNNIAEAYRRWGITLGKTKDIVVAKIIYPPSLPSPSEDSTAPAPTLPTTEDIWAHLSENVKGTPVPLSDEQISKSTDWPKLRKYYALNGLPVLAKITDEAAKVKEMERLIIMRMALRGL
ncbi:kinase binding protein CGI-121-domain-containing protein [Lasiosphaeria hispida]|uniref:EKC/KEOPS complex subunit CGI121 n=1 Tax=Lasiosphaeria hispida TaxID=260671 RepID=A0AAJ0M8S8_9PEZI|nr:kinase binding protein CGI-121-domain-containing protein [Lasiosphaeria hispida]